MQPETIKMDIICPICKKYVRTYTGWGWTGITGKCKKCKKIVAYDFEKKKFKIIKPPYRGSAGAVYY